MYNNIKSISYFMDISYTMLVCCPHCDTTIEIIELNCRIFRCGVLKSTGQQIDPH